MCKDLHEENRLTWNAATVAHNSHKGDQVAFFRTGGSTLHPEVRELLGDIQRLSVAQVQCNAGQDTLNPARLGAQVTGIDISKSSIKRLVKLGMGFFSFATPWRNDAPVMK